ncbi:DNA polymerase III subunit beta [Echinimonas agarilytica]|uniref:Beta sliding clamp n=1 Tax=Echinimonas agarilytica TaxID=1215918 RepID=A0AA42B657_9GAMM|nr:DNA polymerase III subunit beta [Echinimonas agarilytica]MCM2678086.1 DNA polymerase III subunit beta [Echinimonas agarilytica]
MKFTVNREQILKPLQAVSGAVERKHTLPILANILMRVSDSALTMIGTDLEVELCATLVLADPDLVPGSVTVPAKKLVDICRTLPDGASIQLNLQDDRLIIKSGRSRFTLSTLPDTDFPQIEESASAMSFTTTQKKMRRLIELSQFSMANQDVRYYLNGMLFEIAGGTLTAVATDGHRLALSRIDVPELQDDFQCIVPRKGILEMMRLLEQEDKPVTIQLSENHIRADIGDYLFTSKLVDGRFPDYRRVLPRGGNKLVEGDKETLKQGFARVAILSNEKFRGVRLQLSNDELKISANNPEQEEAEEAIAVEYQGDELEVGFNVSYILDVLNAIDGEAVRFTLSDANSSGLIENRDDDSALYVVMPMRL